MYKTFTIFVYSKIAQQSVDNKQTKNTKKKETG